MNLLAISAAELLLNTAITSIEEVAERLPIFLNEVTREVANSAGIEKHTDSRIFELYVFGWSELDQRMKSFGLYNHRSYAPFELFLAVEGLFTTPEISVSSSELDQSTGIDGFLKSAVIAQRRILKEMSSAGDKICGGEICRVLITPNETSIKTLHRFDDYSTWAMAAKANRAKIAADGKAPASMFDQV